MRPYLPCTVASYVHTVAELHVPRPARQCQPPAFQLDGFTRFPTTTSPPHHHPRPSSSLAPQHLRTEACPHKPSHARSSPSSSVFPMLEDGGMPPPTVLPVPIPHPCSLHPRTEVCPHQPSHHCWRMPTQHRPCALRCQDSVFARPVYTRTADKAWRFNRAIVQDILVACKHAVEACPPAEEVHIAFYCRSSGISWGRGSWSPPPPSPPHLRCRRPASLAHQQAAPRQPGIDNHLPSYSSPHHIRCAGAAGTALSPWPRWCASRS